MNTVGPLTLRLVFLTLGLALLSGCALLRSAPGPQAGTPMPKKHPLDRTEYRNLVLDNQLRVMLVSDPKFNKSAAAMVVGVGLFSDPDDRPGMAHYLEHMLSRGSEKYPGVDDFDTYLNENGGYDNAYTDVDHTNYYFEVNHEAFPEALERHCQFFISPLFNQDYSEREVNAVHSEWQKNLEQDHWRTWRVQNSLARSGHPASRFALGSRESLANIDRLELVDFYERYYSANQMQLALLSTAPLDSLEAWVRSNYSAVPDRNLPTLQHPSDYLLDKPTFRLIQIEPIKEVRTLELEFALPGYWQHYESKPLSLLSSLIGHEGRGSLLSMLKKENLATGLGSGFGGPMFSRSRQYGKFSITISLTPQGLEQYRRVAQLCMSYIEMLVNAPYPEFHFREEKAMAALDEIYADRGEGGGYARTLAWRLSVYPPEVVERVQFIYTRPDSGVYREFLSYLRPDNMMATLTAKGLEASAAREPHWGIPYSYSEDDEFYASLVDPAAHPVLHLPEPNPFVPKEAAIPTRQVAAGVVPDKVIDEKGVVLYHSEDFEFLRPKIWSNFKLRFPAENMAPRFKVLLDLYTSCVKESLNEFAYPAALAGLRYSFDSGYEGVYFSVSGYDESAPLLFERVLEHMQHVQINQETFAALKDNMLRGLRSFDRQAAYQITSYNSNAVINAVEYPHATRLEIVEELTLEDIHVFAEGLYQRAFVEGLVHGNVSVENAVSMTRTLSNILGIEPVAWDDTFVQTYLSQPEGEALYRVDKLEVNNSCFWREYRLGTTTPYNRAVGLVLTDFLHRPFFTEMRTNQQLGYIVWAGVSTRRDNMYLYFIIQSGDHAADVLEDRANAFIAGYPLMFRDLPPEVFAAFKAAAAEKLKEKQKSIAEWGGKFNREAFEFEADFTRDEKVIEVLETLSQEAVAAMLERLLSAEGRQLRTVLAFSRDHEPQREVGSSWEDLETWKEERVYR